MADLGLATSAYDRAVESTVYDRSQLTELSDALSVQ